MSLAMWFDLGGDASLVVGVVTVRVVTESGGRIQAQAVGGQESYINRGPKSTLEKPDFSR